MYKALKSFSGLVSMTKGQIKDIKDENIINDLLRCGYIEKVENEIKEKVEKVEEEIKEEVKKVTSKKKSKTKK